MIVVPNHGAGDALRFLVNKAKPDDLVLRLFRNDVYPAPGMTAASFDEPTFPGYAAVVLDGAKWAVSDGPKATAEHDQQPFVRSADGEPQTVYGYFMTRARSGRVAWAERFTEPVLMSNPGDSIVVTPRLTGK